MVFDYDCTTRDGELFIDGISLHTPAWVVLDTYTLWTPATKRGEDLLIPFRPGVHPLPRRITTTTYSLQMIIRGSHSWTGAQHENDSTGMWANVEYLRQNIVDPNPADGASRRYAELIIPGAGTTLGAMVHVDSLELGDRLGPLMRAVLTLTVPTGRLEPVTP